MVLDELTARLLPDAVVFTPEQISAGASTAGMTEAGVYSSASGAMEGGGTTASSYSGRSRDDVGAAAAQPHSESGMLLLDRLLELHPAEDKASSLFLVRFLEERHANAPRCSCFGRSLRNVNLPTDIMPARLSVLREAASAYEQHDTTRWTRVPTGKNSTGICPA